MDEYRRAEDSFIIDDSSCLVLILAFMIKRGCDMAGSRVFNAPLHRVLNDS